jgi:hypothetical protein
MPERSEAAVTAPVRISIAIASLCLVTALSCRRAASCAVCGRDECGNVTFTLHLQGGRSVETCCPRCGLHAIEQRRLEVASLEVRDFDTARTIDARAAFYVEGSDVSPCSSMHGASPPRDERGCCLRTVYDRCLPSVLAFASSARAAEFARGHGGTVRSLGEIAVRRGSSPSP